MKPTRTPSTHSASKEPQDQIHCCGLTWELSCFSKNPKHDKPLLRRISGGAPIHTHFKNSKTKTHFKDIQVSYSTSFTATGISMLQMYSQTAVRLRLQLRLASSLRCCCSKP